MSDNHAKHTIGMILLTLGISASAVPPSLAQEPPGETNEIAAVFRISRQFLADETQQEVVSDLPLNAMIVGLHCRGTIHGKGQASIKMDAHDTEAVFTIETVGYGTACITGVRGPIVAYNPSEGPFTSQTLIRFDGRKFTPQHSTAWADVSVNIQRVTGRRDRPAGRIMGAAIRPMARRMTPRAEQQASQVTEKLIGEFADDMTGKVVTKLNQKSPVEESLNRLFPKTKDWGFRLSTSTEFVQAAYGPMGVEMPTLPEVPSRIEHPLLEIWLRSTNSEARALADLSKKPLAKELVQAYLQATLPKLAALAEDRSIDAGGSWIVIRVGAPKSK